MLLVVAATEPELRAARDLPGVEALACGVGPVDAAARVAARLASTEASPVAAVLHVGIAGLRRGSGLAVGQLVIGARSTYVDTSSSLVARTTAPDPALLAAARALLPETPLVTIGTGADVGSTTAHDAVDVEAMEGFAVLRAAELAGLPAIEVRALSNEVEEPDRAHWRFADALDAVAGVLPRLAETLAGVHTRA